MATPRVARTTLTDVIQDVGLIGLSIAAAVLLARSGTLHDMLASFGDAWILGSFIAGIFFTSIFTAAPAIAVILLIAQDANMWLVALVASLGSLVGDFIMFRFARDRFAHYLKELIRYEMKTHRLSSIMRMRPLRWVILLIGALIIASPLPDELGVALLGFARLSSSMFAPLAFVANFLGIAAITLFAQGGV
jgi:membrane protein YqaA with SNARE-associated domain